MGLNQSIKEKMDDPPSDFQELVDLSIQLDNRNYELRMEKQGKYGQGRST